MKKEISSTYITKDAAGRKVKQSCCFRENVSSKLASDPTARTEEDEEGSKEESTRINS